MTIFTHLGATCIALRAAARAAILMPALMLLPTGAAADFAGAVNLSSGHQDSTTPQVASSADGTALIVWAGTKALASRIFARTLSAAGNPGPVQLISTGKKDAILPHVAVNGNGAAVIVWEYNDGTFSRIQARTRSAAGVLGPVLTLSRGRRDSLRPYAAIDPAGNVAIVWVDASRSDRSEQVMARTISAAGLLGPLLRLSPVAWVDLRNGYPQVAMDAAGNALFMWLQQDGSYHRVQARALSAAGALGRRVMVSPEDHAVAPQLAMNAAGRAVMVWEQPHDSSGCGYRIAQRSRSARGRFGPFQFVSECVAADKWGASSPDAAVDGDGNAVMTWVRSKRFETLRTEARVLAARGTLGPTHMLGTDGGDGLANGGPRLAIGGDNNAVIVWREHDGSHYLATARTLSAAGALGPVQTLSEAGEEVIKHQVAAGGNGSAVAVWRRDDDVTGIDRVQAAAGP